MSKKATNFDVLKSYYFSRLLDIELLKNEKLDTQKIEDAIRSAEIEF